MKAAERVEVALGAEIFDRLYAWNQTHLKKYFSKQLNSSCVINHLQIIYLVLLEIHCLMCSLLFCSCIFDFRKVAMDSTIYVLWVSLWLLYVHCSNMWTNSNTDTPGACAMKQDLTLVMQIQDLLKAFSPTMVTSLLTGVHSHGNLCWTAKLNSPLVQFLRHFG